jgi:hypothetical protein
MAKASETILDVTERMIKIIAAELRIYGVSDAGIQVITNQIVDVWEVGGTHALAVLSEAKREQAEKNALAQLN